VVRQGAGHDAQRQSRYTGGGGPAVGPSRSARCIV
jgi:hypothetical protein